MLNPINPTLPTIGASHNTWGDQNNGVHSTNIATINGLISAVNSLTATINGLTGGSTSSVAAAFTKTVSNLAVTVNGSTSTATGTTIASYAWDFGDSGTATGATPAAHTYAAGGTYTITLTVTGADGTIDSISHSVTVAASGFVLRQTKPDATTSSTGVIRTAPTSGTTATNSTATFSTSGTTFTGQHFTAALITVNAANITFNDCLFDGRIQVTSSGSNMTISNCEILGGVSPSTASPHWLILTSAATGAYIEYSKIHCSNPDASWNGVGERNFTLYRCEIYNVVDGIDVYSAAAGGVANAIVQGCYVHDMLQYAPDTVIARTQTHNDAIQWQGGSNVQVIGCNFVANNGTGFGSTSYSPQVNMSCVMITPNVGACTGGIFEDNWFDYGKIAYNGTTMTSVDSVTSFKRNRFGPNTKNGSTIIPCGLDASATNGYVTTGTDINYYSATGAQITYFFS